MKLITVNSKVENKLKHISLQVTGMLTKQLCGAVFPKKITLHHLAMEFPTIYEQETSLPSSQQPASCPYPKPDKSSLRQVILLF
jgi:hypothetical protein